MGCDIHLYVERRDPDTRRWVTADTWTPDAYSVGRQGVSHRDRFYDDRSYDLFAILAGVRNGSGFAGIRTGAGFVPISAPRGVPEDACAEYRAEVESWDSDGHSHSWLTVAELMSCDWTQHTRKQGWVEPLEWARWRDTGRPESWSGAVSGSAVEHRTSEDFEAAWAAARQKHALSDGHWPSAWLRDEVLRSFLVALNGGSELFLETRSFYCSVSWEVAYHDVAEQFLAHTLPRLWRLGPHEDVRICFFFDN